LAHHLHESFGLENGNKKLKWVAIILVLTFFAGCASPAKKACLKTDWRKLGYDEGVRGEETDSSLTLRRNCRSEGVTPDMRRYEQGRRQGIEKYCSVKNGRAVGIKGSPYLGVCPPDLEASFKTAYLDGLHTHLRELSAEMIAVSAKQDSLRRQLADVEEELSYLEKEFSQIGPGQVRMLSGLLSELRRLETDEMSLDLQIDALEEDLKEMRQRRDRVKKQADKL